MVRFQLVDPAPPFPIDLPLKIYYKVTLAEENNVTTITLTGQPINATADQEAVYNSIMASMEQGFGNSFDQLQKYLAN